jgi:hypothetical protein
LRFQVVGAAPLHNAVIAVPFSSSSTSASG